MKSSQTTRKRTSSGQKRKPNRKASVDNPLTSNANGNILHPEVPEGSRHLPVNFSLLPGNAALIVTLLVTLLTLALRVYYVTLETSWWILHPDEIYQSLEGI